MCKWILASALMASSCLSLVRTTDSAPRSYAPPGSPLDALAAKSKLPPIDTSDPNRCDVSALDKFADTRAAFSQESSGGSASYQLSIGQPPAQEPYPACAKGGGDLALMPPRGVRGRQKLVGQCDP